MKGLIRNNFYSASSDLKIIIPICFVLMVSTWIGNNPGFTTIVVLGQMIMCFAHIGTGLKKDVMAKWDRFELTMPVKRSDVVLGRYISFLAFAIIGVAFGAMSVIGCMALGNTLNFERITYSFTAGITMILMTPAFAYPLMLKFGGKNIEAFTMYSLMISMGLFLGLGQLATLLFPTVANISFRIFMILFSIAIFLLSCIFSLIIYKKKDL